MALIENVRFLYLSLYLSSYYFYCSYCSELILLSTFSIEILLVEIELVFTGTFKLEVYSDSAPVSPYALFVFVFDFVTVVTGVEKRE